MEVLGFGTGFLCFCSVGYWDLGFKGSFTVGCIILMWEAEEGVVGLIGLIFKVER